MATPPMLRPRSPSREVHGPDPLAAVAVVGLSLIALALFAAAVLAVYTYATPAVELPLVIATALAFVAVSIAFVLGHAVRRLRMSRSG